MRDINHLSLFERALQEAGDTHGLVDIVRAISDGSMQSFAQGNSWAVTTVIQTPKKKVCEIFLCVGRMDEALVLHDQVEQWARSRGCDLLRTIARRGWEKEAKAHGWLSKHVVFMKELV